MWKVTKTAILLDLDEIEILLELKKQSSGGALKN